MTLELTIDEARISMEALRAVLDEKLPIPTEIWRKAARLKCKCERFLRRNDMLAVEK